ncbi:hypothetical protein TIFTF001_004178 [Ficus carica]|uniref:Uncharacterized protein n=1 Tax=Ficus carica TaxID=3494 RepID=A0AA87ZJY6_FICCA|nr:hypothetical protein TIFTF001_004178 [Ficus carica]
MATAPASSSAEPPEGTDSTSSFTKILSAYSSGGFDGQWSTFGRNLIEETRFSHKNHTNKHHLHNKPHKPDNQKYPPMNEKCPRFYLRRISSSSSSSSPMVLHSASAPSPRGGVAIGVTAHRPTPWASLRWPCRNCDEGWDENRDGCRDEFATEAAGGSHLLPPLRLRT